jgi:hypothetical protein
MRCRNRAAQVFLHPPFEIGSGARIKIPVPALQNDGVAKLLTLFLLVRDRGFELRIV